MRGPTLAILQVDAFTERPFAGNPAGVVLDADGLSEARMQAIAAEMNVAETAFVSATTRTGADRRLRWFTPAREVTYCGHATVATVHAMVETGRLDGGRIAFDTLGGLLEVEVDRRADGAVLWLVPPLPALRPVPTPVAPLAAAVGLPGGALGRWAEPALTPDGDVLLPAPDLATLRSLVPDGKEIARLGEAAGVRGLCVVSRQTMEPGSGTHCRFFAPHIGIPEDPVTGSVHSSIGAWLFGAGLLATDGGRATFTGEQGDSVGRPGRLLVEVTAAAGRLARVRVGGRAVTVLEGRILA